MVLGFAHPHNSHTNQVIVRYFCPFAKAVKTVGNKTQGREISCQQPCTPTSKKMYELRIWISNRKEQRKPPEKGDCTERCIPESGRPTVRHMSHCIFSVTAVMASMWPLLATPSSASMTPHDIITHHITAHDITRAERLKAGWHKKLWRTQCDTSSLLPYRTCYQTSTLGMNDQPVWVRQSLFKHESKSWAVRPRTQICWTFTSPLQKSCVACWARPRSCYFPENVQCSLQANIRTRNKKTEKRAELCHPCLDRGSC